MDVVLGPLPSLLPKLDELLADEYKLQKEVKGGIMFLRDELGSMKAALERISNTPADQLPNGDKIWARNVRELSYDIEDNIDTFMVQVKSHQLAKKHGFERFIEKTLGSLMQPKIRRKIAIDIRDIKSRFSVIEVIQARDIEIPIIELPDRYPRYKVNDIFVPVKVVDPRAELVGIDEARDEVIKILIEGNEVCKQDKIISIVGFGGLGKTTLASVVYAKLRSRFDCSAFVSVSQTPDVDKLLKDMFYQLAKKYSTASINVVIEELRKFLHEKRYLIVVDDIWDISCWNIIRRALPDDSDKYRIITTTRILSVAEKIGGSYQMKPLSHENSRILMSTRIFGKGEKDKCLDEDLAKVSDRILKKCAGFPLAIIMVASLLVSKGRDKLGWYLVCYSIGPGLEEDATIENMRKLLILGYYGMPSHLRTCLLYLSMFPEDKEISKDHLIWLWIAEGFIQFRKQGYSLFVMGESYFNELINRSMIQPIYDKYSGTVKSCCVHDMVLDLICSLSREENFATIWNGSFPLQKVRRLSLQSAMAGHGKPVPTMDIEYVRSVVVFPPAVDHIPTLQNFRVLRVLDLRDCDLSQGNSLKYLGHLLHLRYLGLRRTCIYQLPEEIGNLRFLQILEVAGNRITSLPWTIVHLTNLMCLYIDEEMRVPKGLGSLTALEDLSSLGIRNDSTDIIEELGHLTELKVLEIISFTKWNDGLDKSLIECLNKLNKIQSLQIIHSCGCNLDGWVVINPQLLHRLVLRGCWLSTLPAWVNPLLLLNLSFLDIRVRRVQQEDFEILGRLPALWHLDLTVDHEDFGIHGRFAVGDCSFACLERCTFQGFSGSVVFQQGAMPRLRELQLQLLVRQTREINGGFDLGLGNLPSLQDVLIWFRSGGASTEEVKEAKATVTQAIKVHHNHPTLRVREYIL